MSHWNWKVIGQWTVIVLAMFGAYTTQDRRLTRVEADLHEQMNGYVIVIANTNARLDRIEDKLDRLIENGTRPR